MTAPEALTTEADFNGVTLKAKGTSNTWSDAMSFWACKDSSNTAASHFVGLWGLLTPDYLKNAKTSGKNIVYSWKFDWNKDGVYEQQINLNIDPNKVTLADSEKPEITGITGNPTEWTKSDVTLTVNATDDSGIIAGWRVDNGEWKTTNSFTVDKNGTYEFEVKDAIGNISAVSSVTVTKIDKDEPTFSISLDPDAINPDGSWTNDEITVTIDANDNGGCGIDEYFVDGNEQTGSTFKISDDNEHTVNVSDKLGNKKSVPLTFKAKYDKTPPEISAVSGNPTVWVNTDIDLTVTADDGNGIGSITYSFDNGETWKSENTYTVSENGTYNIKVKDGLGNISEATVIVVDKIDKAAPERVVKPSVAKQVVDETTFANITDYAYEAENTGAILYYDTDASVEVSITEANFESEDDVNANITITDNDTKIIPESWTNKDGKWTATITITGEGDHIIKIAGKDKAGNPLSDYESQKIVIDTSNPTINVSYSNKDVKNTIEGREYFDSKQVATIKITERNFRADNVVAKVKAKDIFGNNISIFDSYDEDNNVTYYKEYLANRDNWYYLTIDDELTKDITLAADPNLHIAEITFEADANYTLEIEYEDLAKLPSTYGPDYFTVDTVAPTNLNIEYDGSILANIVSTLTFGLYQPDVIVKISATDATAGIESFKLSVQKQGLDAATDIELPTGLVLNADGTVKEGTPGFISNVVSTQETADKVELSFKVPANFRGRFIIENVTDLSKNPTVDEYNDNTVVVVDSKEPTRTVTYTPNRIVDADPKELTDIKPEDYKEGDDVIFYYNKSAVVTFEIKEANFDLSLLDDSDKPVIKVNDSPVNVEWTNNKDVWTSTYTITGEGDYQVEMTYSDKSENEMIAYKSPKIVIDEHKPLINVSYSNKDIKNTIEGREYFDSKQVATIEIVEDNFRADDVVINVKAKDVLGKNVDVAAFTFDQSNNVTEYLKQGQNRDNWSPYDVGIRRTDKTFVLDITYDEDANYTFEIDYEDLATNQADKSDPYYFTVDKTDPECVEVKYSETVDGKNIIEKILNAITFGSIYYNEQMEVTITAKDDISGINHFVYSYEINDNVSKVNAELLNQTIAEALEKSPIVRDENSSNFTAKFNIPKDALTAVNQFNGTVHFTAFDRSERESKQFTGKSTIVVDNIKPTASVTFNDPVQKVNDISYYSGNIDTTIVINEANFYSEDVKVVVTKNGTEIPVKVDWKDNSVDVHTGTFTLTEDGDYVVKVTYVDRSTNEMTPFTSNQLTIDTKDPVINVSNIKHQSANNKETIGFTISVTDTNIALDSFKPTLNAVIKKENGKNSYTYETIAINLGDASETKNAEGDTVYSYTVENLEVDGFYSLECTAVDYANHSVSLINTDTDNGGNGEVETVNFSVNRDGSVFWIETNPDELNGKYVNGEVTITLHEVNVDEVDVLAGKETVLTLNDGTSGTDIVLTEKNYDKNRHVGAGGWYETVYTLRNDNFDHDGVYSFNIITYDRAGNSNVNTKTDEGTISFTLDRTKPVISANIQNNQRVNDTEFWVEFEVTETNLDDKTIDVNLIDNNGKTVDTSVESLGYNEYKFLVGSGYNYSVQISAKDLAGNESEIYKVEHLTISTNIFILWYANTPLFWGSIGGTIVVAGGAAFLILLKKGKFSFSKR